jgi:WD40 repeat protein
MKNQLALRFNVLQSVAIGMLLVFALLTFVSASTSFAYEKEVGNSVAADSPVTAMHYVAGSRELIATSDGDITVHLPEDMRVSRSLRTQVQTIHDIAFSHDRTRVAVAGGTPGETGRILIYSWPESALIQEKTIADDVIYSVAWNPDETLIAGASLNGKMVLCDAKTLETKQVIDAHPGGCTSVAFSLASGHVITGGRDAAIRFWDVDSGAAIRTLSQHGKSILKLMVSPKIATQNSLIVSISLDRTVRLWDSVTGRMIRFVRLPASPVDAVWENCQQGELLLWAVCEDGRVRLVDLADASIEQDIFVTPHHPHAIASLEDRLVVGGSDASIVVARKGSLLSRIKLSDNGHDFVLSDTGEKFRVRGFNYDHDANGNLLEDYWDQQWSKVEEDFGEMQRLGVNTIRIHLQFAKFMNSATEPNEQSLQKFEKLVQLAERHRLYLDITGLGCYHKKDVPKWYDELNEEARWEAQANFWRAIVARAKSSPAIFCWDLMNEPVVPGGKRKNGEWLGPPFGDKHFVQFITLDQAGRDRTEVAKAWIRKLATAIRQVDSQHLITVGLVDWSLNRPGLTSGFVPETIASEVDFISVHLYPESGKASKDQETLKGFQVGKPVVIEECFPLRCTIAEQKEFLTTNRELIDGWISFYWGETPEELESKKTIPAAILKEWLTQLPE